MNSFTGCIVGVVGTIDLACDVEFQNDFIKNLDFPVT